MYTELSLLDVEATEPEVRTTLYQASELPISGVCLLPHYLNDLKVFVKHGLTISSVVDYPYGIYSTTVRNHILIDIIKRGVNAVDLVVKMGHIVNRKFKKTIEDVISHRKICYDNNVTLRVMLQYNYIADDALYALCKALREAEISYVIPSTGLWSEDFTDNLIIFERIKKRASINVIGNLGSFVSEQKLNKLENIGIFGLRFKTLNIAKNFFQRRSPLV